MLLHMCTRMWFFHLHLSPKQCEYVAVCLKRSLIWLISLHSELNFLHGQKSYFLLDCRSLFCFVVQSCIAISLKNNFCSVTFQTNKLSHILSIKMGYKQNLNVSHFLPNPNLFLFKLLYPAIVEGYSYGISIKSQLVLQLFNLF